MKLSISRRAANPMAFVCVAARTVLGLAVDAPLLHSGAWMAALLGVLPVVLWLECASAVLDPARGQKAARTLLLPLIAIAVSLDSASVLSSVVRSAASIALDRVPTLGLAVPVCLAALWCVRKNGDSLGYGAILWSRIIPVLMALVVLLQFRRLRPSWLLPIFGYGGRRIACEGVLTAGWALPASSVLLIAEDAPADSKRRWTQAGVVAGAAGVAALIILLRLMMAPTLIEGDSWLNRVDALLTNGRAPLYLQLPLMIIWFSGLLQLFACECFCAAALWQRCLPAPGGMLCAVAAVASAGVIALTPFAGSSTAADCSRGFFIVLGFLTGAAALTTVDGEGGQRRCARL